MEKISHRQLVMEKFLKIFLHLFLAIGGFGLEIMSDQGRVIAEISIPGTGPSILVKQGAAFSPQKDFVMKLRLEVQHMMQKLVGIPAEKFPQEAELYRSKMELYIEESRKVCHGDFSSFYLEGKADSASLLPPAETMNPMQKSSCFRELRIFQRNFMERLLEARIKYLDDLHKRRVLALKSAHQETLKYLELNFEQKTRKTK